MILLSIKFKSTLSYDDVIKVAEERLSSFQALKGLIQKYYGYEQATGEFTGVYIWESEQHVREYRESELSKTIAKAYRVEGTPRIEMFEIPLLLRS